MIRDIYIRSSEDSQYNFGILEHSNAIESIISKIKVLFGTRQGEVLGDLNFGLGIEDLVFETRINKTQLEEKIKRQINSYISESADYKIEPVVSFGRDQGYDYAIIDILINNEKRVGIVIK